MSAIYKTLQSKLNKANAEQTKWAAERAKYDYATERFRMYDDLLIAERAKALALETAMERELKSFGAKEAIDQFNNGLVTLKELVNKLVEIERTLSK